MHGDMNNVQLMIFSIVLLLALPFAFAHMIGGNGWSGAVMRFYLRIVRAIFGWPIMKLGELIKAIGKAIKG